YITTIAGRGYCFVAPVSRASNPRDAPVSRASSPQDTPVDFLPPNLPSRPNHMVGRDDDLLKLSVHLTASRLVTIVGAGGVGKTTVAIATAHQLLKAFASSVLFVDLGMLKDPRLAATTIASMLGIVVQSDDATPSLIAYLKTKRCLLILDTCEHLIE